MMSPQIDLLAAALCELQGELQAVEKNSANPFFKSHYADLSTIWEAVRPLLHKHGLSVVQIGITPTEPCLQTTLLHKSGQWINGMTPLLFKDNTMQSLGSAWTYARRYGLAAVLGVSQRDDDGNEASHTHAVRRELTPEHPPEKKTPGMTPQTTVNKEQAGEHIITVGKKFAGKQIKDLSFQDYSNYANYLEDSAQKDNKPLSRAALDFILYGDTYFGVGEAGDLSL